MVPLVTVLESVLLGTDSTDDESVSLFVFALRLDKACLSHPKGINTRIATRASTTSDFSFSFGLGQENQKLFHGHNLLQFDLQLSFGLTLISKLE